MAYSWKSGILGGVSVAESATAGTPLATLVAQDGGVVDAFYYTLTGQDSSLFNIDLYGRLSLKQAIDYDTTGGTSWWRTADGQWHAPDHRYTVVVNAFNDADQRQITTTFILTVGNVNDNPTNFAWAQQPIGVNQWRNAASGLITVNVNENNAVGMAVGQFSAIDGDYLGAVTYNLGGTDAAYFSINNNGALTLKSSLDYESTHVGKNYSVVVTATSTDGSPAVSSLFVVSLGNVDDNATAWSSTPATGILINEKEGISQAVALGVVASVANFKALDADGQTVTYGLAGDDKWMFSIDSNGTLYRTNDVDYETSTSWRASHQFSVTVLAGGTASGITGAVQPRISSLFILTINAVDEAPVWSATPLGTKVLVEADGATYNYTDPFTIPVSTGGGQVFTDLNPSNNIPNYANGAIVTLPFDVVVPAPYSTAHIYYRLAGDSASTIRDAGQGNSVAFTKGMKLTAFQAGVFPTANGVQLFNTAGSSIVVQPNYANRFNIAGGIVATFAAVDPEGAGVQYSVSGTDANRFIIDGNGKLILTQSLDYEAAGGVNYSVVVVATDGTGHATSQNFVLSLGNSNDEFAWSGTQTAGVSLLELTGTQVVTARALATFAAYDSDANGGGHTPQSGVGYISYKLEGADKTYFNINKDTGVLSFVSAVDAENGHGQLYSVTIWANEKSQTLGTPWISQNFVLTIGDVDESAIIWKDSNSHPMTGTVAESYNSLRTIAKGEVYPIDLIIPVSPFTWFDLGGGILGAYGVTPPLYANGYSVTLPYDIVISGYSMGADARQVMVRNSDGSITMRGGVADGINGASSAPYSYTIAAGAVIVGYGTYDSAGYGAYLKDRSWDINVSKTEKRIVTLAGGIDVLAPTDGLQNFLFTATDSDVSNIIYSVSGTEAANFTVASDVGGKGIGKLTYIGNLDYESASHTHTVTVVATSGNNKVTQLFILSVTGLNDEAAVWTSSSANGAISENNVAGVALATFLATDPDGAGVTYSLSGTDANLFSLSSSGGGLQLISALNYEGTYNGHNGHVFSVIVNAWGTAGGAVWGFGLATTKLFVLSLGNVNEFATGFAWAQQPLPQAQYSQGVSAQGWSAASSTMVANINENNTAGMTVAQFLATDGDTVPVTYSLSGVDAGFFDINGNGALTLKSSLDYESTHVGKNYSVVVTATSTDGSPAVSSLFVVSLGNVDDNATVWSGTPVTGVAVNETAGITNTVVLSTRVSLADFRAIDGDGQTVKYSLAGDTAGMFSIDSNGVLYRTRNVDYETSQHQFSVTVWAWGAANTDGIANDGAGINKLFILTINNVNEFGTGFTWAQQPIGVNQWRNGASGLITVGVSENNAMGMAVGQFAATDGDQVAVTYNLGGTDAAYFSINNNGALTLKSSLNYEDSVHTAKNYSVVVTATSTDGSPAVSSLFVVSLGNVDDNATVWSGTPATGVAVNETAGITNTVVLSTRVSLADFRAIDADGQTVKYSLAGDTAGMFSIDSNGVLYRTRNVDYETSQHQFSVTVWAWGAANTDGIANDGAGINKLFILTINNVNEFGTGFTWAQQPIGTNQWRNGASGLVTVGVNENNAMGMAVGQFAATDGDQVAVTYNLGGTDAAYFSINNNGALTLKSSLDYESTHVGKNYSVVVTATSTDGSPAVSSLFVVSLGNVDDNATVWSGTPVTGVAVNETAGITNTVVLSTRVSLADFRAIDGDGQTVKYSLAGDTAGMFSIDSNGVLYRTRNVDYETSQHQFSVTVWAWGAANTDGIANDGAGINKLFILTINNVNEFGTGFTWAQQPIGTNQWRNGASGLVTVGVNENNAMGMAVGQFAATDGDQVAVTYNLGGTDAAYFSINNNGALTLKSSLDYESTHVGKNYSVVVTATSTDGSPAVSSLFVVSLGNVDDNATVWSGTPATGVAVNETAGITNTVVLSTRVSLADFRAIDGDGQTVKYSLAGDTAGMFSIDSNGVLYRTRNVDYETSQHQFSVTVWAWGAANTDGIANDGAGINKLFILTINNVNELGTGFTWAQQPIGTNQWRNGASGLVTVGVNENNAMGMAVGQFAATDGDQVAVTYNLGGTDAAYFSINNNGALTLKSSLDYESTHVGKNYSVVVTATSTDGSPAVSSLFVVSLGNVDDNATVWSGTPATGVAVNETAGITNTVVLSTRVSLADFRAIDGDGQTVKYSLAGDTAGMFSIDSNGVLYRTRNVDYETSQHQFSVTVWAWGAANTDGIANDGAGINKLFILTINNVNELGTGFTWAQQPIGVNQWRNGASGLITVGVSENNAMGMAVGQFAATDGDGVSVTYSLSGADAGNFSINNNGALTLKSSLDYESRVGKNYSVVVTATSTDGSPAVSSLFVVSLQDSVKEFVWTNNPSGASISETAALVGATVADFNIGGGAGGTAFTEGTGSGYWLVQGFGDVAQFNLNQQTGVLTLRGARDYETDHAGRPDHRFSVAVGAWRDGGGEVSHVFVLTVTDANEAMAFQWQAQPLSNAQYSQGVNLGWSGASSTIVANISESITVGGLQVAKFKGVDADIGVYVTYNLGGTDATYFSIDTNGRLYLASNLDYESTHVGKNYSVVVTAKSTDGSAAISNMVVISLSNVDDNATAWSGTPVTGVAVNETAGITNTVVLSTRVSLADFRAIDGDGQTVKYSLVGDTAGMFSIDSNGVLYRTRNADYETSQRQFSVTVWAWGAANTGGIANDGAGINKLFILTINNVNDGATNFTWAQQPIGANQWRNGASGLITVGVNENNAIGMAVGQFAATDGDQVAVTYNLGGTDAAYFSINNNGALTLKSSLNYEDSVHTAKNYSVVVTATSTDGSPAVSSLFVVSLGNVDDNATVWSGTPATGVAVNETAGITNTVVLSTRVSLADFRAIDADGQTVKYSLAGDTAGMFSIDSNGVLYRTRNVDYETSQHQFSVTVWAWGAANTDGIANDGAGINKLFILTINSVNELGTGFTWAQQPIGTNQWRNGASGLVTVGVNENNAIGMAVGQFAATDGDQVAVTYNLGGTDAAYFSINNNGALTLKSSLDYEDGVHTAKNYSVVVTATSTDGSPAVSSLFVVSLGNVDDNATVWSGTPATGVAVNETAGITNTVVLSTRVSLADFRAIDGDGQTVKYSLAGDTAGMFSIDSNGVLYRTRNVDYETSQHQFSVTVWAWGAANTDGIANDGAGINKLFILTINNVNEFGTGFTWAQQPIGTNQWRNGASGLVTVGVNENNAIGMAVGQFAATDGDQVAVTYNLGGTDAAYFSINNNGALTLKSSLDYESTHVGKNYSVVVTATSTDGSPAVSSLFVVSLGNVDDNATAWSSTPATGIAIDEKAGIINSVALGVLASVANFKALDADGQTVTYSLDGADKWMFSIDSNGVLYRTNDVDYETSTSWRPSHQFSVTVWAWGAANSGGIVNGGAGISKLFVLTINNISEPTNFSSTPSTGIAVNENNVVGLTVGSFRAIDGDGAAVTYSLGGTDATYFSIDTNGNLKLRSILDFEDANHTAHNYSVVVQATSTDGGATISSAFVLSLGNVAGANHADHTAYIDGTTATHVVNVGGIIGHGESGNIDYANVQFHGVNYTDKVITHNVAPDGLQSTMVDYVSRGISDLESLRISFNGFTDTDGSKRNHWFFVQDDATDNSGHIVFDADGQNVNLHSFANGGGLATADQINLLAGSNYGIDGDFAKPTDLNLNLASDLLHQNIAGALTFDQFLALLGGSQHISFV